MSNGSGTCEEQIDAFAKRVAPCRPLTDADREAAIEMCESLGPEADPRSAWRPEFRSSVDACAEDLTCEDFAEDLDDLCYPPALAEGATGLISEATITACISGETDTCEQELALDRETGTSVVSQCFRRWIECAPELPNTDPYWTEDYCGTLIAITDEHRADAEPCISLGCKDVAACLQMAGAFNF